MSLGTGTAGERPQVSPGSARKRATPSSAEKDSARYDHGLAEFPAFRFGRRRRTATELIEFKDTIRGPNGRPLHRKWTVHPSRFGYGGATTQALLFDLHECWREQGFNGNRIYFGTLRKLYQRQHPGTAPSKSDYERLRRDLAILCGYVFHCDNAFWDPVTKNYGRMNDWSLFTAWFEPSKRGDGGRQEELPFGFIEVSDTFSRVAKERGFFVTGFDADFFHSLRPLEQRLALYLSKFFASQTVHRRFASDICAALPIEGQPNKQRHNLKLAAEGLIEKGYPNLEAFKIGRHAGTGNWLASFKRKEQVAQDRQVAVPSIESLPEDVRHLIGDVIELTNDPGSTKLWLKYTRLLGPDAMRFALADLKSETLSRSGGAETIKNRGAWLNTKLQEMAKERGVSFERHDAKDYRARP